jgi:small subunit ribosomal protein S16
MGAGKAAGTRSLKDTEIEMAVTLRLARHGATKSPFYRVVAADERYKRDGRYIELIGTYDPKTDPPTVNLQMDRVEYWLGQGAKPSQTVTDLLKNQRRSAKAAS